MIMNQKGKGQDNFETPDFIYNQLNSIFNFTLDAACTQENCKCLEQKEHTYWKNFDGLFATWRRNRVFCNPPFSQKAEWIKKAYEEVFKGGCPICVMILPILAMDTKAWHQYIERGGYHMRSWKVEFPLLILRLKSLKVAITQVR